MRSLWTRRTVIVLITAFGLLPAIVYIRLATPLYTSTSNLLIVPAAGSSVTGQKQTASPAAHPEDAPADTVKQLVAEQSDLITSTPVLAAALAAPGVKDCQPLRDHHDLIEFLKRSLKIKTGNGSEISVSIASSDPDDASCILAAVDRAYGEFLSSLRRNGNSDLSASLVAERIGDQSELATKSADLLRFGEEHHVGTGMDVAAANNAELAQLAQQVNQAHLDAVAAKAASDDLNRELSQDPLRAQDLKQFEKSASAGDKASADDESLIRSELLALKAKQADLQQKLMPGHPSLVKIQQQIEDLNLQHDAAIQRRAIAAANREADLQHAYDDEQKRILDQAAQQAEYSRRNAEVVALQKAIDDLGQRIASLDVAENSNTPTVTVLEPARASLTPTSPNRQRILLFSGIAGLVLGCLVAVWLERGRWATDGLENLGLKLPILAELPILPNHFGPIGNGSPSERRIQAGEAVLDELFNGLNAVVQGVKNRGRGAVVLITSPSRGDGKSTIASNLAMSLAHTHKRVLLIDADLRSQSQSRIFGIGNATGLGTLLEADVSIPITAIHHTGTPSLDVIPGGPLTRNPSELLNSERFIDLMGDLAERYDYVLVDSPPTVSFTDARTISASSDLTMMVVRANQLNRRLFQIACDGLTTVGANLCGLIINSGQDQDRSNQILEQTIIQSRLHEHALA
jgi:polysaccharide biosynthesis transport protein